jgi:hypothetical protein
VILCLLSCYALEIYHVSIDVQMYCTRTSHRCEICIQGACHRLSYALVFCIRNLLVWWHTSLISNAQFEATRSTTSSTGGRCSLCWNESRCVFKVHAIGCNWYDVFCIVLELVWRFLYCTAMVPGLLWTCSTLSLCGGLSRMYDVVLSIVINSNSFWCEHFRFDWISSAVYVFDL